MSGNKGNILQAGLELYNTLGVPHVRQRTISEFLQISPGNLTYHFKKKDDLCEALYFEFIEKIEAAVGYFLVRDMSLLSFATLIESWFKHMYEYRFIFIDLSTLIRTNKKIKENYHQMIKTRESIFLKVLKNFVQIKIILPEQFDGQFQLLYNRLTIVSDFYLSSIAVLEDIKQFDYKEHKKLFFSSLYPILTSKGKNQYHKMFAST